MRIINKNKTIQQLARDVAKMYSTGHVKAEDRVVLVHKYGESCFEVLNLLRGY